MMRKSEIEKGLSQPRLPATPGSASHHSSLSQQSRNSVSHEFVFTVTKKIAKTSATSALHPSHPAHLVLSQRITHSHNSTMHLRKSPKRHGITASDLPLNARKGTSHIKKQNGWWRRFDLMDAFSTSYCGFGRHDNKTKTLGGCETVALFSIALFLLLFVTLEVSVPAFRIATSSHFFTSTSSYDDSMFPWKTMHRSLLASKDDLVNSNDYTGHSSPSFFDKSEFYRELRAAYDNYFPVNDGRSMKAVENLQSLHMQSHPVPNSNDNDDQLASASDFYDIYNCPDNPPRGYPMEWSLWDEILTSWPADDMEPPASGKIYNGLCVFDYHKDYDKAIRYRNAEVPFVVKGDPAVARTVERWNQPHYMDALLGDLKMPTEYSDNSQFMYWTMSRVGIEASRDYKPPTESLEMTYSEWIKVANLTDDKLLGPNMPHYYFKVQGCSAIAGTASPPINAPCAQIPGAVPFLADELPFVTQATSSLYIKDNDPTYGKPINCRFGMKGVLAANHFDGERNFVTVLQGERRYILSHPSQCSNLALFEHNHPSARHSMVDYTNPDLQQYPEFGRAKANEVVLQPGDSLFLPSLWFHFIASLSLNVQCNTRSGLDWMRASDVGACGY